MLSAYINEYGEELMNALQDSEEEVEAELVVETTEETGRTGETDGVDPSEEE